MKFSGTFPNWARCMHKLPIGLP